MRAGRSFEQCLPCPGFSGQSCPRGRDLGARPCAERCSLGLLCQGGWHSPHGRGPAVLMSTGARLTKEFQVRKSLQGDSQHTCWQQRGSFCFFLQIGFCLLARRHFLDSAPF